MYRILLLLFLCLGLSLTAPQQGDIETIADVKPTIFDYPAEVYDVPAPYPSGESPVINAGRQDFSADDINYGITTENIDVETTDYNEDGTNSYDKITESIPHDYESRENTAEIYSKLGYFTNNYLPGHKNNLKQPSNDGSQPKDLDNKLKYIEAVQNTSDNNTVNSTKDKLSIVDKTVNSEGKSYTYIDETNLKSDKMNIIKVETNLNDTKQNLENRQNSIESTPNYIKKIVEDKPNYETSKPTYFSTGYKGFATANSVLKASRRKFRSNCRCEKIWNCPKLQISVPRCPNEYFMCCF